MVFGSLGCGAIDAKLNLDTSLIEIGIGLSWEVAGSPLDWPVLLEFLGNVSFGEGAIMLGVEKGPTSLNCCPLGVLADPVSRLWHLQPKSVFFR